jgi:hypothetical protein
MEPVPMPDLSVKLTFPADIGALVVSRPSVRAQCEDMGAKVHSESGAKASAVGHHDFGATTIAIIATAGGAAAIKGLFDLLNTVVKEVYQMKREKRAQEHELQKLLLQLGNEAHAIDFAAGREGVEHQLESLRQRAAKLVA